MSTFSQFAGGGGGIKSIQRGTITIGYPYQTGTATITSVNPAKTELRFLGSAGYGTASGDGNGAMNIGATVVLTNATTITATLSYYPTYPSGTCTVSWELTEWN